MGVENLKMDDVLNSLHDWFVPDPDTQLQDGDITVKAVAEYYRITEALARKRMNELAEKQPDKWRCILVKRRGHDVTVLRAVKQKLG